MATPFERMGLRMDRIKLCLFLLFQFERSRVDAVAQTGWFRAVGKVMTQVRAALGAHDLGATHEEFLVIFFSDVFLVRRLIETRPAGAGVELGVGAEQFGAAAYAAVHTVFMTVVVGAGKGTLGAFLTRDVILLRGELLFPLGVGLGNFRFHGGTSGSIDR